MAKFTKITSVLIEVTRLTPTGTIEQIHGQGFWLKHDDKTYVVSCAHGGYFAETITVNDVPSSIIFFSPEYDIMLLDAELPASSSVYFTLDDFMREPDTSDLFMNKKRCRYFSDDSTRSALPAMAYTIDNDIPGGRSGAPLVNTDNKLVAMIQQYNMSNKTYMAITAAVMWKCLDSYFTTGAAPFCQMSFMFKPISGGVEIMDTLGNQYKYNDVYNFKDRMLQTGDIITKVNDLELINGRVTLPVYGVVTLDAYVTLTCNEGDIINFTVDDTIKQVKTPLLTPYMTTPFYAPERLNFGGLVLMDCSHALIEVMMQELSVGPRHLGYIKDYRPIKPSTPQNLVRTVVVANAPKKQLRKIDIPYINDHGLYTLAIVEVVNGTRVNSLTHLRELLNDKTIITLRVNDNTSWKLTFVDGVMDATFTKVKSTKNIYTVDEAGPSTTTTEES